MESRKIQLVGNRSYSVSLPKKWVLLNKLKEQDTIFIEPNDNNELVISSINASPKINKKEVTVTVNEIENISEFLMFCYIKNINNLKLLFKKQDYKKVKSIKHILKYLEGYDIVSEDEKKIEISFLFNDININLQKILIRMTYLLRLLLNSLKDKDSSTLEETENSIDRIYHLSKRIIFSSSYNQEIRNENNIKHYEDLFFYKDIFKKLENIGDLLIKLKEYNLSDNDEKTISHLIDLLYDLLIKKQSTNKIKLSLNLITYQSSDIDISNNIQRIHELCIDIMENSMLIEFNKNYF